jgi:putative ABC transport system permease protein
MRFQDNWHYSAQALFRHKTRTLLLLLTVAISVASVLLLTSIGEGAKHYVEQEFSALGSKMLIVLPGKKETTGGAMPIYGTSPRDLTIEDAQAISHLFSVQETAPIIAGTALISHQAKSQEVITIGSTRDFFTIRSLTIAKGRGFPSTADDLATPICIIGDGIKQTLFGNQTALGQWLRISGQRFRVTGILPARGESLGLDLRNMVIIPVRSAAALFNTPQLFRIIISLKQANTEQYTEDKIRALIKKRHDGEDDITIVSQNAVMSSFTSILNAITIFIGAIASISLVVAGLLIMNVSFISVNRRKQEIGLLKALGATSVEVRQLFMTESSLLISIGVMLGLSLGYGLVALSNYSYPTFTLVIPWWAAIASSASAFIIGLLFTWLPASVAAKQDPVLALRGN